MGQCTHARDDGALLSSSEGAGADEHAGVLAPEGARHPLAASLVPEGLPLGWEVTVSGGDTEYDGVVWLEVLGLGDGVVGFGRGVHFGEDFFGEGLCDSGGTVY